MTTEESYEKGLAAEKRHHLPVHRSICQRRKSMYVRMRRLCSTDEELRFLQRNNPQGTHGFYEGIAGS